MFITQFYSENLTFMVSEVLDLHLFFQIMEVTPVIFKPIMAFVRTKKLGYITASTLLGQA